MAELSYAQLAEVINYDPKTGKLFWKMRSANLFRSEIDCKRWNARFAGKEALASNNNGYKSGYILNRPFLAHRVAWMLSTGFWPKTGIDHIDGNPANNKIENLREATQSVNNKNAKKRKDNTSGITGVAWFKKYGKWVAYIRVNGRRSHLGYFYDKSDAQKIRDAAARTHGFHENHGR